MSYYSPPVIVDPHRAQSVRSQHAFQAVANPSLQAVPSPMVVQQQIPQYMPTTMTTPIPIPARNSAQPVSYMRQPHYAAESLPMSIQQPQPVGYPTSGYTYGTPATTQSFPSSVGGPYIYADRRPPSSHPDDHRRFFGHRHHCGHCHRHGHHHWFPRLRHRTYSDPEYDYRYRRR